MNEFDRDIEELKSLYAKDPARTSMEVHESVLRLRTSSKEKTSIVNDVLKEVGIDKLLMGLVILIIILTSLFAIKNSEMGIAGYLFGMIFFFAGYFVSTGAKGFGLIFLFSHGGIGFGVMMVSLLQGNISLNTLSDLSTVTQVYLGLTLVASIFAFIVSVLYNLSDELKKRPYAKVVPLALFALSFLLAGLFPYAMRLL